MVSIRPATLADLEYLASLELTPDADALGRALNGGKLHAATLQGTSVGFLSFTVLWGTLPFLEYFEIEAQHRGRGLGARATRAWELDMGRAGFDLVLVSTQADGDAQHFWRKMGYVDCGALTVRGKSAEVFFQKAV